MMTLMARILVVVAFVGTILAGGPVSAEPEPDRVCVFGGYPPHVYFDECVDVPSYPDWFPDPQDEISGISYPDPQVPTIPDIAYFVPRIP